MKLIRQYLRKGPIEGDDALWKVLMNKYEDAFEKGQNAIHSIEDMSLIPKNDFVKNLYRPLQEKWDVQVIITYRPFHQW